MDKKHSSYYIISNKDRIIGKYSTLKESRSAVFSIFDEKDMLREFNEFEKPMIIKMVWDNNINIYTSETYTPFIYYNKKIRFFRTQNNYESAVDKVEDYMSGAI